MTVLSPSSVPTAGEDDPLITLVMSCIYHYGDLLLLHHVSTAASTSSMSGDLAAAYNVMVKTSQE